MLLLHMQEIVFVDSQEGLLSSRGGGGPDILAPGLHYIKHNTTHMDRVAHGWSEFETARSHNKTEHGA